MKWKKLTVANAPPKTQTVLLMNSDYIWSGVVYTCEDSIVSWVLNPGYYNATYIPSKMATHWMELPDAPECEETGEKDMKTEMKILPNGNYEQVNSPIQHECRCENYDWRCRHILDDGHLILQYSCGDPYEDGCEHEIKVKFCPFCGYQPQRSKP